MKWEYDEPVRKNKDLNRDKSVGKNKRDEDNKRKDITVELNVCKKWISSFVREKKTLIRCNEIRTGITCGCSENIQLNHESGGSIVFMSWCWWMKNPWNSI